MSDGKVNVLSLEEQRKEEEQRKRIQEQVRKLEEQRRKDEEKRRKIAEKKEADYKKMLSKKLPEVNRQLSELTNQLSRSEKNLMAIRQQLSSEELSNVSRELDILAQNNAMVKARIEQTLSSAASNKLLAEDTVRVVEDLSQNSDQVKKSYKSLERKLSRVEGKLQQLSVDFTATSSLLTDSLDKVTREFTGIARTATSTMSEIADNAQRLDEQNARVNEKLIALYESDSSQSLMAFMEVTAFEQCGYALKGVESDEELNLWFEQINGDNKIAVVVKPIRNANSGVNWLKELRISSDQPEEDHPICETQAAYLAEMGVEYSFTARKAPKSPPPGSFEEWEASIDKRTSSHTRSNSRRSDSNQSGNQNKDKA